MKWILNNWYGLVSILFLILAIIELTTDGTTTKFWADMVLCFVTQCTQAVLNEIRKGPDA